MVENPNSTSTRGNYCYSTGNNLSIIFLIFRKQYYFLFSYKKIFYNKFSYIFLYQLNNLSYSYFILFLFPTFYSFLLYYSIN
jgi:hypothetical protein